MREQEAHTLALSSPRQHHSPKPRKSPSSTQKKKNPTTHIMRPPNRLTQRRRNIDGLDLGALQILALQRHRIRHHQLAQPVAGVQIRDRVPAQDAVRADGQHLGRAVRLDRVGRLAERAGRVAHVVDQDRHLALHLAHQHHLAHHARFLPLLVDHREIGAQPVRDRGGPLDPARVRRDDHDVFGFDP